MRSRGRRRREVTENLNRSAQGKKKRWGEVKKKEQKNGMGRRGEVLQYTGTHNMKPDERVSQQERKKSGQSGQPSKKKGGIV